MRSTVFTFFVCLLISSSAVARRWRGGRHQIVHYYYRPAGDRPAGDQPGAVPSSSSSALSSLQTSGLVTAPVVKKLETTDDPDPSIVENLATVDNTPESTEETTNNNTTTATTTGKTGGKKGIIVHFGTAARGPSYQVDWFCNWSADPNLGAGIKGEYVPQRWGTNKPFQVSSSPYALYYNEPELCPEDAGSCVRPDSKVWENFPAFKTEAQGKKVSSPCVKNDEKAYLENFLKNSATKPDILCFHWYGPKNELEGYVKQFAQLKNDYNIPEIWLSEFGVKDDSKPLPDDVSDLTSMLDGMVDRYAYNLDFLAVGGKI